MHNRPFAELLADDTFPQEIMKLCVLDSRLKGIKLLLFVASSYDLK